MTSAAAVPLAILDTNVIVAGLLTRDARSPPTQRLDGLLPGRLALLLSEALLMEYRQVLRRDRIQRIHGLSAAELDHVLTAMVTNAILREPPPPFRCFRHDNSSMPCPAPFPREAARSVTSRARQRPTQVFCNFRAFQEGSRP